MQQSFTGKARDVFILGLRNAHAMEKQALSIMKPQESRIENYPQVAQRLRQHIEETNMQIERLDQVLGLFDESASGMKDAALSAMGGMAALGHSIAGDEIIKNSLANFAFENYEIAAYSSLLTLADACGLGEAKKLLEQNLAEERQMAKWLEDHLGPVTLQFAELKQFSGTEAKI